MHNPGEPANAAGGPLPDHRGSSTTTRLRPLIADQNSAYTSPWPLRTRLLVALWQIIWKLLASWTPNPLNPWRLLLLRQFGTTIEGRPYVAGTATVRIPWQLSLLDRACLGEHVEVYNLDYVIIRERATVAQHVYLCGGTHDLTTSRLPLVVGPIDIGPDVFIGAKAFILPGVTIGPGAVVGAGAVVTRDLAAWQVHAGNPAKPIKPREFKRE